MTKKNIRLEYDPYDNHIMFNVSLDSGETWQELADTSELLKYQNQELKNEYPTHFRTRE